MSDRADRLELITRLQGHAGTEAALAEIKQLRIEYEANLGRTLTRTDAPVDQREIDYKRGFFRGMAFAYAVLPRNAGPQLERLLQKELAERSDTE
jgi:hypothetical protein